MILGARPNQTPARSGVLTADTAGEAQPVHCGVPSTQPRARPTDLNTMFPTRTRQRASRRRHQEVIAAPLLRMFWRGSNCKHFSLTRGVTCKRTECNAGNLGIWGASPGQRRGPRSGLAPTSGLASPGEVKPTPALPGTGAARLEVMRRNTPCRCPRVNDLIFFYFWSASTSWGVTRKEPQRYMCR